jgi:16S rRNA G966 N2-methylase RsmD
VRIACGDWKRVCTTSVTTKHGLTGVFLDPPYDTTEYVYGKDSTPVSAQVNAWCAENGSDPKLRIVLAGRGEEHDNLLELGWNKTLWSARRGYAKGDAAEERHTEALWSNFNV